MAVEAIIASAIALELDAPAFPRVAGLPVVDTAWGIEAHPVAWCLIVTAWNEGQQGIIYEIGHAGWVGEDRKQIVAYVLSVAHKRQREVNWMFRFSEVAEKAIVNGTICAKMAITPFIMDEDGADVRIWSDPYVLGIIQGMIVGQCLPAMGVALDEVETGLIVIQAMENIGSGVEAIRLSAQLANDHDLAFMRGYDEALTATLLMTDSLDPSRRSEPDIVAALKAAPKVREGMELPAELEMDDDLAHGIAYLYAKVGAHRKAHYYN